MRKCMSTVRDCWSFHTPLCLLEVYAGKNCNVNLRMYRHTVASGSHCKKTKQKTYVFFNWMPLYGILKSAVLFYTTTISLDEALFWLASCEWGTMDMLDIYVGNFCGAYGKRILEYTVWTPLLRELCSGFFECHMVILFGHSGLYRIADTVICVLYSVVMCYCLYHSKEIAALQSLHFIFRLCFSTFPSFASFTDHDQTLLRPLGYIHTLHFCCILAEGIYFDCICWQMF